jgi:DNA-binding NarL/FixJ family response regulator
MLPGLRARAEGAGGQADEGFPSVPASRPRGTLKSVTVTPKPTLGTLVVVDDHAGFRQVVRARLTAAGWHVIGEASTGGAVLEMVMRLAPDLVLLDVVLPDMDGFAVAERLAAAGCASAVVLISGHDRSDFGGRVRAAPVRGFLAKEMISGQALARLLSGDRPGDRP